MRAERCADDRVRSSDRGLPWIGPNLFVRNDLLNLHNRAVSSAMHKKIDPSWSAQMLDVAVRIGVGRVQYRDVHLDWRNCQQGFAADGIFEDLQIGIYLGQRGTYSAAPGQKRKRLRGCLQSRA